MMGISGDGMKASRDCPVLMIPLLVHLWQPGPDVYEVGRTRAGVRESERRRQLRERETTVRKLSSIQDFS